jgi:hypothetical protein
VATGAAPTNATAVDAIPSTDVDPFEDNIALIGGIAGGVVALLLVGGLIAAVVVVARKRRGGKGEPNAGLQSIRQHNAGDSGAVSHRSNYAAVAMTTHENEYGVVPENNYENGVVPHANNFNTSTSASEYDHGNVTKFNK